MCVTLLIVGGWRENEWPSSSNPLYEVKRERRRRRLAERRNALERERRGNSIQRYIIGEIPEQKRPRGKIINGSGETRIGKEWEGARSILQPRGDENNGSSRSNCDQKFPPWAEKGVSRGAGGRGTELKILQTQRRKQGKWCFSGLRWNYLKTSLKKVLRRRGSCHGRGKRVHFKAKQTNKQMT